MWDILKNRWKQGHRTLAFPFKVEMPERFLLATAKDGEPRLVKELDARMKKLFGRSLKLRVVCAGSCNGCEMELQALGNVVFDLSRFGIQFVASPRHADGLLVTGPVTKNMAVALKETYEAICDPKIVIAVGACAINGGPFEGGSEVLNGAASTVPVDLFIPGCPPHPLKILEGLLKLLGRCDQSLLAAGDKFR